MSSRAQCRAEQLTLEQGVGSLGVGSWALGVGSLGDGSWALGGVSWKLHLVLPHLVRVQALEPLLQTLDVAPEKGDAERLQKWLESLDPDEMGKYKM